jgi:hypothetical protein
MKGHRFASNSRLCRGGSFRTESAGDPRQCEDQGGGCSRSVNALSAALRPRTSRRLRASNHGSAPSTNRSRLRWSAEIANDCHPFPILDLIETGFAKDGHACVSGAMREADVRSHRAPDTATDGITKPRKCRCRHEIVIYLPRRRCEVPIRFKQFGVDLDGNSDCLSICLLTAAESGLPLEVRVRLKVGFCLLLTLWLFRPVTTHASCSGCYDMSGTWDNPFDPNDPSQGGFTWELVQDGTTVTGMVFSACDQSWPVSGTIDPDTGSFSLTATQPGSDEYCVGSFTYDGAFDTLDSASGSWANSGSVTGSFTMTLQAAPPTLTVNSASVTRGSSVTFSIDNLGSGVVSNWRFVSTHFGTVSRGSDSSSTWPGTIVDSGTARVRVVRNGVAYDGPRQSRSVTVQPRSFALVPVQYAETTTNGFTCQTTSGPVTVSVPVPIVNAPENLARYCLELNTGTVMSHITDGGPNHDFRYVSSRTAGSSQFVYLINPDLKDVNCQFYLQQTGSFDPVLNPNGYISGDHLKTNAIRHEVGQTQSHNSQFATSYSDPANNPGTAIEAELAGPGTDPSAFTTQVNAILTSKHGTIATATNVEPYGAEYDANYVFQGYTNYTAYTACHP